MTAPRQILEGVTYLVTRRCSERRFFLRPSKDTDAIFRYVLAVAANRYGIQVHAYCVLSNHFHLVVTDPQARLPEFHRYLDGLVARAMNCSLGRWDGFWERNSYSAVKLETDDAVLEKMVYVLANPVAAGLVRRGREWPGLWSDPGLIGGEPIVAERPTVFFRNLGRMPASASLRLCSPPGFSSDDVFAARLREALNEAEDRAASELEQGGRSFLGVARVLAQKPRAHPSSGEPRRGINPRVACRSRWKRIEALQQLKEFGRAYASALAKWRAGLRNTIFPPGTWLMRVQHRARCEAAG
ncbi:transposase [Anaeromyxobacter oryzisoli]|uniref:transposase n=1 Tax=Anaeromyxobacter oryzisoli TaxID=2925408 RepID=UPI001F56C37B|nr:transposase [Anaeromyxobacter sp. SG63]